MSEPIPTYINQATDESPFAAHRDLILGRYSAAITLQGIVLGCWSGSTYPANLSGLAYLDETHRAAALAMLGHYARNGENDQAFMAVADEIIARRDAPIDKKDR